MDTQISPDTSFLLLTNIVKAHVTGKKHDDKLTLNDGDNVVIPNNFLTRFWLNLCTNWASNLLSLKVGCTNVAPQHLERNKKCLTAIAAAYPITQETMTQ